ncbi:MAG TPA: ABC transporter permease [Candidatus Acidoferrales bacterium]|jgi:lipopolysaccharide transport system permease protein|nr:ABC transporter permease [Candidatus Acidoferrales bacterium]
MATATTEIAAIPRPFRIAASSRIPVVRLGELWAYRELLYFFVWRDVKVRYKQTAIGAAWAILQPFLSMIVFSLFFGRLAKLSTNGLPYPIFYYCALLPWSYFAGALQSATNTIVEHQRLITKIYFPRLVLPISAVLSGLVDFAIAFVMLIAMMLYYKVTPGKGLLLLPGLILLALLTALAFGLWLSALNAVYRDVRYAVPFMIQFWMFVSPVAYSASLVPERWRWIYGLNPMAGVVEGFRWALTDHAHAPGPLLWASACGVVFTLLGGVFYFRRMEGTLADVV